MKKSHVYCIIGNAIEFYDFTIFAFFTPLLGKVFFPSEKSFLSLLFGLTILGSAFIARPIGGILFGHIADKYGRRISLICSLFLMAIATLSIGILPTPDKISIISSLLLFFLRFTQGLSAGGEYWGVSILLMETAPFQHRNFWGAFVPMSCGVGALLAVLVGQILQNSAFPIWTWRIAFIFGGCVGFLALLVRIKIPESPEFEKILNCKSSNNLLETFPIVILFRNYLSAFCKAFTMGSFHSALITCSFAYVNIYLHQVVGFSMSESLFYNTFCLLCFILTALLVGYFSDRLRQDLMARSIIIAVVICAYPIFFLLCYGNSFLIIIAEVLLGFLTGTYAVFINGYAYNLFSTQVRASGISIGYSFGMGVVGSTMPIICSVLVNKFNNPMMPAVYLIALGIITLVFERVSIRFSKQVVVLNQTISC